MHKIKNALALVERLYEAERVRLNRRVNSLDRTGPEKVSIEKIAKCVGCSQPFLSMVLLGTRTPNIEMIERIDRSLDELGAKK